MFINGLHDLMTLFRGRPSIPCSSWCFWSFSLPLPWVNQEIRCLVVWRWPQGFLCFFDEPCYLLADMLVGNRVGLKIGSHRYLKIWTQGNCLQRAYQNSQSISRWSDHYDNSRIWVSGSGSEQPRMRAFEGYLRKKFDEEAAISLSDVHSVESFWKYHNESFMPATRKQYEIQKTIKHTHTHTPWHNHFTAWDSCFNYFHSHVIFQKPIYL